MTKDICENFNRLNLGDDGENSFEGGVSAKKKVFWRDFLTLIVFWKTNPQWSFSFWAELKSPTTFESTSV